MGKYLHFMKPHLNNIDHRFNFIEDRFNFVEDRFNLVEVGLNNMKAPFHRPPRPRAAARRGSSTVPGCSNSEAQTPGEFRLFGVCAGGRSVALSESEATP